MSERSPQHDSESTRQFESDIRRFEDAWKSEEPPRIVDYLSTQSRSHLELLVELVHIDLEFRFLRKEEREAEHYFYEFPLLLERREIAVQLIQKEYQLRRRNGQAVVIEEYLKRFPQFEEELKKLPEIKHDSTLLHHQHRREHLTAVKPNLPGYEIQEEIGRGGMGVVYRASQPALQRMVAIKTLLYGTATTGEMMERFRGEAASIARLDHPNLVPVYEIGEWTPPGTSSSLPFFVMKFYPGGSLANSTPLLEDDFRHHAQTVETIAFAVHHAHQRGILHRDLKPSNILLDEKLEPHVVDFGLAGRFDPDDPQSMTATVMGTPAYMAPEQARSPSQVTTAADVYGLGAILYQLLTGKPPFEGATPLLVLEKVANQTPTLPAILNPRVPKDLQTICMKCLEKDPARRYDSAAALARDLERYRTGQSIFARPLSRWERGWRLVRRHPIISSLTILTFAILTASVIALTRGNYLIREQESETRQALVRERWMREELLVTLDREQQLLYGKRIASVGRLWAANQLPQAWTELEQCPERLRGWEWKYFQGLKGKEPITISTGDAIVRGLKFISESELITCDSEGVVTIWDWRNKIATHSWSTTAASIRKLDVLPEKNWVAISDADHLQIWNYRTKEKVAKLAGNNWVSFSPDGRLIAANMDQGEDESNIARVWETGTWKEKWQFQGHKRIILSGTISPDSKTLTTTSTDYTIRHWSLETGKEVESWVRPIPTFSMAYLPGGKILAEGLPSSMVWTDTQTGKELGRHNWTMLSQPRIMTGRVQVATGPIPDQMAFSGPSHEIQVWDVARKRAKAVLRGHNLHIGVIDFSPKGTCLASGSNDKTVRIWELEQPAEYKSIGTVQPIVHDLSLSAKGEYLAACPNFASATRGRDLVKVIRLKDGSEVGEFPGVGHAAFTTNDELVTTSPSTGVTCWNLSTKRQVWHQPCSPAAIIILRQNQNGTITSVQADGKIRIMEAASGRSLQERSLPQGFNTASLSPDGNQILFVGKGGVECWDLAANKKQYDFPINNTRIISFSGDGKLLAIAEADRVMRLRNAKTGELILTFPGHPRSIHSMAFNSRGNRVVTSCADGLVRIWCVETGLELTSLPGIFEESVLASWDQASDRIIAVDNKVHIWSIPDATK